MVVLFPYGSLENPQEEYFSGNIGQKYEVMKLKFFGGPMNGKEFEYDSKYNQKIVIGRNNKCDIVINS